MVPDTWIFMCKGIVPGGSWEEGWQASLWEGEGASLERGLHGLVKNLVGNGPHKRCFQVVIL